MNKKTLSESDICDKFIRPAMESAGWDGLDQIFREYPLRAGRMVVRGRQARRDISTVLRADYALFYKPNIPLAVVEAKDNTQNPHAAEVLSHDPDELLREYARLQGEAQSLRDQLKAVLAESLGGKS